MAEQIAGMKREDYFDQGIYQLMNLASEIQEKLEEMDTILSIFDREAGTSVRASADAYWLGQTKAALDVVQTGHVFMIDLADTLSELEQEKSQG